jgi:hypothetical protein
MISDDGKLRGRLEAHARAAHREAHYHRIVTDARLAALKSFHSTDALPGYPAVTRVEDNDGRRTIAESFLRQAMAATQR